MCASGGGWGSVVFLPRPISLTRNLACNRYYQCRSTLQLCWRLPPRFCCHNSSAEQTNVSRRLRQTLIDFSADETQLANRLRGGKKKKNAWSLFVSRGPGTANHRRHAGGSVYWNHREPGFALAHRVRGCANIHKNRFANTSHLPWSAAVCRCSWRGPVSPLLPNACLAHLTTPIACATATSLDPCQHRCYQEMHWR